MQSAWQGRKNGAQYLKTMIFYVDWWLVLLLMLLMGISFLVLNSAADSDSNTLERQMLRFGFAWVLLFLFLCVPVRWITKLTPWVYLATVVLLLLVDVVGMSAGGAQRWLNLGVARVQPSELAKLSVPMMVAWYASRRLRAPNLWDVGVCLLLILLPSVLIYRQPDLGTTLLVLASGGLALFLSSLSWKMVLSALSLLAFALPLLWFYGLKPYQRLRVMTLFNPEADPLGAGYHIIQSQIAIGSGGLFGKGYLQGTQSQLDFLPESTTDFIFAVIAEEWGLLGVGFLLFVYFLLVARGLYLSTRLYNRFARIVVASVFVSFFINVFVNIGMVSGFLPVVGLPLALISYGGSSILSLMLGFALALNLIGAYRHAPKEEYL